MEVVYLSIGLFAGVVITGIYAIVKHCQFNDKVKKAARATNDAYRDCLTYLEFYINDSKKYWNEKIDEHKKTKMKDHNAWHEIFDRFNLKQNECDAHMKRHKELYEKNKFNTYYPY